MNKKTKPNRYKPETVRGNDPGSVSSNGICSKYIMAILLIGIFSLALIFTYDFITQSAFFNIKKIDISGTKRVSKEDLLKLADLTCGKNILAINLFTIEKHIISHPWIQSASVKRNQASVLSISIIEHEPIAIVKIENLAKILINTRGIPFKEYNPLTDNIDVLPMITGIDLSKTNDQYGFNGELFDSVMIFLQSEECRHIRQINADKNTGITIETMDIYNRQPFDEKGVVQIKLGFDNFMAKLEKAKNISAYMDKNFPEKIICAMDLFNIEKVFIRTKPNTALHHNLEKGA